MGTRHSDDRKKLHNNYIVAQISQLASEDFANFCHGPSPILPFAVAIAGLAKLIGKMAHFCQPH